MWRAEERSAVARAVATTLDAGESAIDNGTAGAPDDRAYSRRHDDEGGGCEPARSSDRPG